MIDSFIDLSIDSLINRTMNVINWLIDYFTDQVVTGGWDRMTCIWDASTGELLNQMGGHDEEIY